MGGWTIFILEAMRRRRVTRVSLHNSLSRKVELLSYKEDVLLLLHVVDVVWVSHSHICLRLGLLLRCVEVGNLLELLLFMKHTYRISVLREELLLLLKLHINIFISALLFETTDSFKSKFKLLNSSLWTVVQRIWGITLNCEFYFFSIDIGSDFVVFRLDFLSSSLAWGFENFSWSIPHSPLGSNKLTCRSSSWLESLSRSVHLHPQLWRYLVFGMLAVVEHLLGSFWRSKHFFWLFDIKIFLLNQHRWVERVLRKKVIIRVQS